MKRAVIIVAGGKGVRMGTKLPKQFLPVAGVPILCRTIQRFLEYDPLIDVYIAMPAVYMKYWVELSQPYITNNTYKLVEGGEERFFSVKNALSKVSQDTDLIAVHDGVRPLVTVKTIATAFTEATLKGNAVPCIPVSESVRIIDSDDGQNHPIDRNSVKLIQTPQVFATDILKKAYNQPYTTAFTDDASVVETIGLKINLIEGDIQNIKITTIEDLKYTDYVFRHEK